MGEEKEHRESPDERLAANLRALRESAGLSQSAVAAAMRKRGMPWHQSTVARIEAGQQPVRFAEAVELAAVLRTSLDRLTWTSPETSAGMLLDSTTARANDAWEQVAAWTGDLLWAQYQLETSVAEAERAGCYGSDRIRGIVRDARHALGLTPGDAVEAGRKRHEELRETGRRLMEEGRDGGADTERQPRVHDQREA